MTRAMGLHPAAGAPPDLGEVMTWWTWDPLVLAGLLGAGALYATGAARLWRHAGPGHGVSPAQAAAYGLGLLTVAIALLSPLDGASEVLFSAHMAQHELLMLVAAPLVVLARPLVPGLWALPRRWRWRAGRASRAPSARAAWRYLTAPMVAFALHALVRWAWHVPAAFDAALADERVHVIQHLSFFLSATLFWWTLVHGRYGRAGYGVGVAFVFFTMMHSGLLAALIALSSEPWYGPHAARTLAWGVDPVADQQRAGLLMWVPAAALMTGLGLALLAAWMGAAGQRVARGDLPGLRGRA